MNLPDLRLPWRSRLYLQTALLTLFILAVALFLVAVLLYWKVQAALEQEFDRNLSWQVTSIREAVDPLLLEAAIQFGSRSRSAMYLQKQLDLLSKKHGLKRIVIFDSTLSVIAGSRQEFLPGQIFYELYLDFAELEKLKWVPAVSSKLFQNSQGELVKRAYTRIKAGERTCFLGIEAGSRALVTWKSVRQWFLTITGIILLSGFVVAYFFARSISVPIRKLERSVQKIREGDFHTRVHLQREDEIGHLAQSIETMRQALRRKDERQKAVLAGIAHELKNPLAGIELFAGILARNPSDPQVRQHAEKILRESRHIQKILAEFNEFGRPARAQMTRCDLRQMVQETADLLQDTLQRKHLQLNISGATENVAVHFDESHLRQVLANLLRNAIHFSPENGQITVELRRSGSQVILDLQDEGPGIPPDRAELIFEPFYNTEPNHTGLGLAIVKILLEENKGRIDLLPSRKGAHFRLVFKGA